MPIQTLVIKLRRAGKQSRQENFLRLQIRYNREIKNFMHFVPVTFQLLRKFVHICGQKRGISQSKYESTDIVYHVMRTGLPPQGSSKNPSFALFQPEFFDSKLNNYRIQSRKFGFGVNVKCWKKCSKSLICPYKPL